MNRADRKFVRVRALNRCEYCLILQDYSDVPHHFDHVRASKHRGPSTTTNTCPACAQCNLAKGTNVAGFDTETDELERLYNPRLDQWNEHFAWDGAFLIGLTPLGRVTIDLLCINRMSRVAHRRILWECGIEF